MLHSNIFKRSALNLSRRNIHLVNPDHLSINKGASYRNLIPSLPSNPNVPYLPHTAKGLVNIPSFQEVLQNFEPEEISKDARFGGLTIEKFQFLCTKVGNFSSLLKVTVCFVSETDVVFHFAANPALIGNPAANCLHGGAIAGMLDHTAGFAGWMTLNTPFERVSTTDLRVDYLKPATVHNIPNSCFYVHGQVHHRSKSLVRCDGRLLDYKGEILASARGAFNIYSTEVDMNEYLPPFELN